MDAYTVIETIRVLFENAILLNQKGCNNAAHRTMDLATQILIRYSNGTTAPNYGFEEKKL